MVAIGTRSAERAKLPTLTAAWLMRPLIGARMIAVAQLDLEIFERRLVGLDGAAQGAGLRSCALSTLSCGVAPLPTSSV